MPISRLQSDILRLIAAKRDPESFVAGGVPINRSGPRYSADLDIFHDRQERVAAAALADAAILKDAGFDVTWLRQQPATYTASVRHGSEETKLEWVADSDYRFFPVVKDAPPIDPDAVMRRLRAALDEAEQFVAVMPSDKAGLLFLSSGRPVQPDPSTLDTYVTHAPKRRGHWPSSPDITAAMLLRLQTPQL